MMEVSRRSVEPQLLVSQPPPVSPIQGKTLSEPLPGATQTPLRRAGSETIPLRTRPRAPPPAPKPKAKTIPPYARFPSAWTGDLTASSRQEVSDGIRESVQKMMDGTWKDCITRDRYTCGTGDTEIMKYEVVQVLRNQNPHTWCEYVRKRAAIRAELNAKPVGKVFNPKTGPFVQDFYQGDNTLYLQDNEMYLFHGTKPSAADAICENHFLPSGAGLFGPGIYFAEMSSKSDEYVVDDVDGIYQGLYATLLCRVTMGRVKYNDEKNPNGDACAAACANRYYNGVIGDREKVRGTYREFIVYDSKQAYPEYVVIYRRTKAEIPPPPVASPARPSRVPKAKAYPKAPVKAVAKARPVTIGAMSPVKPRAAYGGPRAIPPKKAATAPLPKALPKAANAAPRLRAVRRKKK